MVCCSKIRSAREGQGPRETTIYPMPCLNSGLRDCAFSFCNPFGRLMDERSGVNRKGISTQIHDVLHVTGPENIDVWYQI